MRIAKWLLYSFVTLVPATGMHAQSMEDVYETDFLQVERYGRERDTIARYWIQFAQEQAVETEFTYPPLPVDENDLKHRIRAELRQVSEISDQYAALSPGVQRDSVEQQLRAMGSSQELAEKLFQVMGTEYCQGKLIEKNIRLLTEIENQKREQWHQMTSSLEFEPFANRLNLTSEQRADIQTELEKASEEFKQVLGKLLDDISMESKSRWKRLLRVLDAEDRQFTESRIGKPVEWHRSLRKQQIRMFLYDQYAKPVDAYPGMLDESAAVERMLEINPPPKDAVLIDQLILGLIGEDIIWDELELIDTQRETMSPIGQGEFDKPVYILTTPRKRFDELVNGTSEMPRVVEKILLPDQLEWFRQIEFQIRTEPKYDSTVGLLDPRVVKHLQLNDDQQKEMKGIGDEFAETLRTSTEKIYAEKKRIEEDLESKLAELLDEEQLVLYRKFTKAPPAKDDSAKDDSAKEAPFSK